MKDKYFISQRLGFTNAQAESIENVGLSHFLERSFNTSPNVEMPSFLVNAPKTRKEYREFKQLTEENKKLVGVMEVFRNNGTAHWWIQKMATDEFPLREKMVLFWHNHFTSSYQKVKSSWAMFQQNQLFRDNAFGNFKELTRLILYDNAMITYLDNIQNKVGSPNENLSRELLELFTLGIGNYTERDVKEGARALAGLNLDDAHGAYIKRWEDDGEKTYLGASGNLKADQMVDIIFNHPKAAHRITEKLLKHFVTSTPSPRDIDKYAAVLRNNNFEIQPFLKVLLTSDYFLKSQSNLVKDPLSFLLQLLYEFQLSVPPQRYLVPYFQQQGFVLLNPPNVKGWDGGRDWLSSQKLIQRMSLVHTIAIGKELEAYKLKAKKEAASAQADMELKHEFDTAYLNSETPAIRWNKNKESTSAKIISSFCAQFLIHDDEDTKKSLEGILRYDFDPNTPNAEKTVSFLAENLLKLPEFQII